MGGYSVGRELSVTEFSDQSTSVVLPSTKILPSNRSYLSKSQHRPSKQQPPSLFKLIPKSPTAPVFYNHKTSTQCHPTFQVTMKKRAQHPSPPWLLSAPPPRPPVQSLSQLQTPPPHPIASYPARPSNRPPSRC